MSSEKEFSIQEKMHLALNNASKLFTKSQGIVIGCFIILILTIPIAFFIYSLIDVYGTLEVFQDCNSNWAGILENLDQSCRKFTPNTNTDLSAVIATLSLFYDTIMILVGLVILILGGMVTWFFVKGRKIEKDFRDIKNKFIRQSYFFALQTSIHKNENIPMEFLEICEDIFPELKEMRVENDKKGKKWFEVEKKIDNKIFDLVADTKEGKFIVEVINGNCSYDRIQNTLEIINKKLSNEKVFRVIFLAKEYDKLFYEDSINNKIKDIEKVISNFDLIIFNENSFNFLKIGR